MCRGRRDAVVGLALVLLRASAKGLFDEITPAKPRVRSELVLPPPGQKGEGNPRELYAAALGRRRHL